jgi:hypothetical protein
MITASLEVIPTQLVHVMGTILMFLQVTHSIYYRKCICRFVLIVFSFMCSMLSFCPLHLFVFIRLTVSDPFGIFKLFLNHCTDINC